MPLGWLLAVNGVTVGGVDGWRAFGLRSRPLSRLGAVQRVAFAGCMGGHHRDTVQPCGPLGFGDDAEVTGGW